MSSKTKIFVLKSRNLIWTAVIVVIVILLAVLLASALHLDKNQSRSFPKDMTESASSAIVSSQSFSDTESFTLSGSYIPGRYAASVVLGGDTVDIVVCVDKNHINSIPCSISCHAVSARPFRTAKSGITDSFFAELAGRNLL